MLVVTVGHAAGQYDGAGHAERGRGVAPAPPLLHLGPAARLAVAVVEVGVDHLHQLLLRLSGHRRGTKLNCTSNKLQILTEARHLQRRLDTTSRKG